MKKETLMELIDAQKDRLFDMACQIFDNPECMGKEFFAAKLLADDLEARGFQVTRGVGNQQTSFRAVWQNGEGGPNIGILGEYDALVGTGHGCGHHLQTPAAIGAAVALKELLAGSDVPVTLTVYGTPAEESYGGKIVMQKAGCFRELDVVLGTHACRNKAFVGGESLAANSFTVTFHGKAAHAAGAPWQGRSAMDAMLLMFQGVEFLRGHVKDGVRMHYAIEEAIKPANVVPDRAVAKVGLRTRKNEDLAELNERFRKIVDGACLMTETTADLRGSAVYLARKRNVALSEVAQKIFQELGIPMKNPIIQESGGSTDFGNVSCIVPGCLLYIPYCDAPSHSDQWVAAGKTEDAKTCMMMSAKALAGVTLDLIENPEWIRNAKEEFSKN